MAENSNQGNRPSGIPVRDEYGHPLPLPNLNASSGVNVNPSQPVNGNQQSMLYQQAPLETMQQGTAATGHHLMPTHALPGIAERYQYDDQENGDWSTNGSLMFDKRRVSKACDHCRKRKIKCDAVNPVTHKCTNCERYKSECTFEHHNKITQKKLLNSQKKQASKEAAAGKKVAKIPKIRKANDGHTSTVENLVATPDMARLFPNDNSSFGKSAGSGQVGNDQTKASGSDASEHNEQGNATYPAINSGATVDQGNGRNTTFNNNPRSSSIILNPTSPSVSTESTPVISRATTAASHNSNHSVGQQRDSEGIIKRVEQVDRKVAMVIDTMARFEWLVDKLSKKIDDRIPPPATSPKAKYKQYVPRLLTTQKLEWAKSILASNSSNVEFLAPIRDYLTVSLKWYILGAKHTIEYPMIQNFRDKRTFVMPALDEAQSLLTIFNNIMFYHSSLMFEGEVDGLCHKYYDAGSEPLTYPELLVLNIAIAIAANVVITDTENLFKDDIGDKFTLEKLISIERHCRDNAMYYYHKLILFSAGITAITGLLLLFHYLNFNANSEMALDALALAIRYSYDMNLNMNFHYKSLSPKEVIRHRALWWYCFYFDKMVSLILQKPATIKENDMDVLANDAYFETIKYYQLPMHFKDKPEELDKITNINEALSAIINYSEHFAFFISYYSSKLIMIESHLASVCFSIRSTIDLSFDELVQKLLDIKKDLDTWKQNLHPSMRIESYSQYLKMLYAQSSSKTAKLGYDVACAQVIRCHMQFLYLEITLSLFATSFLLDNTDSFVNSLQEIPEVFHMFCRQVKTDSVEACKIFQKVPFRSYLYPEVLHYAQTAIYALLFHTIKNMDDTREIDVTKNISLLIDTHTHLVGVNQDKIPIRNVKVNMSVFFFTFLLRNVIKHFNETNINAHVTGFEYTKYDVLLNSIIRDMQEKKMDGIKAISELISEDDGSYIPPTYDSTVIFDPTQAPIKLSQLCLFNKLSPVLLDTLASAAPIEALPEGLNTENRQDPSLFPSVKIPSTLLFSIHSSGSVDDGYSQKQLTSQYMKNTHDFCSQLPLGTLLFDRDFTFIKLLNKERTTKLSY